MAFGIEALQKQLEGCIAQREQHSSSFQQVTGAITLLQEQIKQLMIEDALERQRLEEEAKKAALKEAAGEGHPAVIDNGLGELNAVKEGEQQENNPVEHQDGNSSGQEASPGSSDSLQQGGEIEEKINQGIL